MMCNYKQEFIGPTFCGSVFLFSGLFSSRLVKIWLGMHDVKRIDQIFIWTKSYVLMLNCISKRCELLLSLMGNNFHRVLWILHIKIQGQRVYRLKFSHHFMSSINLRFFRQLRPKIWRIVFLIITQCPLSLRFWYSLIWGASYHRIKVGECIIFWLVTVQTLKSKWHFRVQP